MTHAPGHNAEFYRKWVRADPAFSELVFKKLGEAPFTNGFNSHVVPASIYIATSARLRMEKPDVDTSKIHALVMGEMLAPVIPDAICLPCDRACRELISIVKYIVQNPRFDTDCCKVPRWETLQAFQESKFSVEARAALSDSFRRLAAPPTPEILAGMTIKDAVMLLLFFAETSDLMNDEFPLGMIAQTMLAIVKQGNSTNRVISKIRTDIEKELGRVISIEGRSLPIFHIHYGSYLNETNIGAVFNQWTTWLPGVALRMSLMVQQAAYSGLTAFCVTGKAVRTYGDFPWARVAHLLSSEWTNYMAAVRLVNGNAFYGFSRDLGVVKSTNYKSLTWVCKELLIRIGGQETLNNYKGWIHTPMYHETLERLISDYVRHVNQQAAEGANEERALELVELVNLADNATIFS